MVKGEQGNLLRTNGITGLQQSLHLLLVSGFQIHLEVDIRRVVNYAKQLPGNGKALSLNGLFKSLLRHNFFALPPSDSRYCARFETTQRALLISDWPYTSVQELRNAAATEALVNEINALPLERELTLSDETQIDNLLQRLEALPAEYAALVANADKLNAAKARMTDIHTRIASLESFIDQNLAAAEITLDSKAMLDEAPA